MKFIYEQPLLDYMLKKGKKTIVVEEITSNNSDFEITELHVQLIDEKRAEHFKTRKGYYSVTTDAGTVLLPPYKLKCEDTITFGLKSFLGIKYVSYKGISK
ncbi:MAG: hypothetical protein J5988_02875 [Eubacterium sp.]|nr:hypothetical protein [Lachnospiraceae bacterium]MBO5485862.1 hypothetical protein [Eubacterium sp.]